MLIGSCIALSACGNKDNPTSSTETGENASKDEGERPALPVKAEKFNDDFIVLCMTGYGVTDFYVDEASTDIVENAMWLRNSSVEEMYGIDLKYKDIVYYEMPEYVSTINKAGDTKAIDLIAEHLIYGSNIVLNGDAYNWYELNDIDFDAPWWPETNKNDLTLNDQCYIAVGDFCISSISHALCFYFNKKLVEQYRLGNIYEIVNNQEWTYDKMLEMVQDIHVDLNNDNRMNDNDLYGFVFNSFTSLAIWIWGFDNPVMKKNTQTGELEWSFYTTKIEKIMRNLVKFYYRTDGVLFRHDGASGDLFKNGQAVFSNGCFFDSTDTLRDMTDWGLVPMPKYNAKQADYITMVGGGSQAMILPRILELSDAKARKVGMITETLEYYSHYDVMPTYYDKALRGKYADSPDEAAMIDILAQKRIIDFGYIYMGFVGPAITVQQILEVKNDRIASAYAQNKDVYNETMRKAYEAFGLEWEDI